MATKKKTAAVPAVPEGAKKLTFDSIMAVDDVETKEVYIPAWDGTVTIKVLTKREQQELRRKIHESRPGGNPEALPDPNVAEKTLLLLCLVEPVISPEQYELLMQKSAPAFDQVLKEIQAFNDMDDDDNESVRQEEAKFQE